MKYLIDGILVVLALAGVILEAGQKSPPLPAPTQGVNELLARGDYDAADRFFASQLAERPGDFRLLYNRALANYLAHHLEKSRDLLLSVAPSEQNRLDYQVLLATVLIDLGDYREALPPSQQAVRLRPSDPENWLRLGMVYLRLKRGQHALDTYKTAWGLFPTRPEFLIGQGVVEEMVAKLPQAISTYKQVTAKFPRYEPGYCFLGQVQIKSSLPEEARATGQKLLRLNPHSAYGEYLLAQADWITPGKGQEARPHVQRALELNPRLAEAALLAGKVEMQAGEPLKAIHFLSSAVQIAPQLEDAHYVLSRAYRQIGDPARAEAQLAIFRELRRKEDAENHLLNNFLATGGPPPQ